MCKSLSESCEVEPPPPPIEHVAWCVTVVWCDHKRVRTTQPRRNLQHFHSKHFLMVFTFDGTEFFGIFIAWIYKFNGEWWWMLCVSHTHRPGHSRPVTTNTAKRYLIQIHWSLKRKASLDVFFSSLLEHCREDEWLSVWEGGRPLQRNRFCSALIWSQKLEKSFRCRMSQSIRWARASKRFHRIITIPLPFNANQILKSNSLSEFRPKTPNWISLFIREFGIGWQPRAGDRRTKNI